MLALIWVIYVSIHSLPVPCSHLFLNHTFRLNTRRHFSIWSSSSWSTKLTTTHSECRRLQRVWTSSTVWSKMLERWSTSWWPLYLVGVCVCVCVCVVHVWWTWCVLCWTECWVGTPLLPHLPTHSYKTSQELISHDTHSNTYNYKSTFSVEIVPVCKVIVRHHGY